MGLRRKKIIERQILLDYIDICKYTQRNYSMTSQEIEGNEQGPTKHGICPTRIAPVEEER